MENEGYESGVMGSDASIELDVRTQVKNQMDILIGQNIVVRSDRNYKISASFINGKMIVNGSEFNLLQAVQQMGGQQVEQLPLGQVLHP